MSALPSPPSRLSQGAAYLLQVVGLAVAYYAAARLGLRYASIGRSISLVWPPTGIALATLVILGRSRWPGVAVGAFLANAAAPAPLPTAAAIAVGNTLEALVASTLLIRVAGSRPRLDAMRTVRALVLVAGPVGAVVSAVIGVGSLRAVGLLPPDGVATAGAVWWIGNLLGALVVAPIGLAWALTPQGSGSARGLVEVTLLCIGTVLAAELGLGHLLRLPLLGRLDYLYLLFPFVVWSALRFGSRGASLITFTVSVVAVWRTVEGSGPFIRETAGHTLFAIGCYLAVVAITGLTLAAAVTSERETATAELRRRDEQLRTALDAARMGVWYWSAVDDRLSWDDALHRLYGLGPAERVARYDDFLARVHPDDRELVAATVRRALTDGGRVDHEFRIVLPDGRIRWISDQGRVVTGEGGRPTGLTGTSTDITERHSAEEQLRLAHRMESVGRLAGGVAHEANNQMSVVIGAADFILARGDIPPEVRSDAEYIRRAAERTAAVTAQLLAFSRRQMLKPQVLDLNQVLERFRPVLQRTMGEDCSVTLRLDPALAPVRADPGQLEQVLLNLALNARDAMPQGGTLSVETSVSDLAADSAAATAHGVAMRPGRYALMAVTDTGHGMEKVTLAQAFEPFFTTKGVGKGSGLGLATVYGIVKQSDGYVWASSEPGQGTTFTIYLPLVAKASPAAGETPVDRPRASGELVLLVEDESAVRAVAARTLVEAGYRVIEAESAGQAIELLRDSPTRPSLVVTDIVMPGMSGPELARIVGRLSPATPVLFMSGYPDREIRARGLLTAGAAFLTKPFSPDELIQAVRASMPELAGQA